MTLKCSLFPVLPVSPVWSITLSGLHWSIVGAPLQRHNMGLEPAPLVCHKEGTLWKQHWKTAGLLPSGHYSLRQPPPTRQKHGLYWPELCLLWCCILFNYLVYLTSVWSCFGGRSCSLNFATGQELPRITASYWLHSKVEAISRILHCLSMYS